MGFTTGLAGGTTLVLGAAYLAIRAHSNNRETQADLLRSQTLILTQLAARNPSDPFHATFYGPQPITSPYTSTARTTYGAGQDAAAQIPESGLTVEDRVFGLRPSERAALRRAGFVEGVKDRWNGIVEGTVRGAQETDWDAVRENVGAGIGAVWRRIGGDQVAKDVGDQLSKDARAIGDVAAQKGRDLKDVAKDKAEELKSAALAKGKDAAQLAKEKAEKGVKAVSRESAKAWTDTKEKTKQDAQGIKTAAQQAAEDARAKAQQARHDIPVAANSIWERGLQASRTIAQDAKAAANSVANKVSEMTSSPVGLTIPTGAAATDAERILQQRYAGVHDDRSVKEILMERYAPIDGRDDAQLKAVRAELATI